MKDIILNDGSVLNVGVNFLTIKMVGELGVRAMQKKLEKDPENEDLKIVLAAKMVYVIIRSSGKMVSEDEALRLVPIDDEIIFDIFKEFEDKMNAFKKKQVNKM